MRVDLHNHTILCNHAEGSVDEYIQKAIESGCEFFGFSDHAPMDYDPKYRMSFAEMNIYENWIKEAKVKYSDKIEILLGYEVDFLRGHMDERVLKADVDYLIGSVHFIDDWGFDNPEFIGKYSDFDINELYVKYFSLIEQVANSGMFDIVGHIDLLKVFRFLPTKDIRLLARDALKAIKKANMTIELNTAGYRKPIGEPYPSMLLLQEIVELDIPITFGSDAHKPEQVAMFSDEIENLARSYGYNKCVVYKSRDKILVDF